MKVKISDIRLEKKDANSRRVRADFGDIFKLAESIKQHGLLHPVVINEDPTKEKKYVLVAGERRIRACLFNGWSEIPATLFSDMDSLDRKICELEENTIRLDLDWHEQIEALRQLDELKRKKYGSGTRSRQSTGWTLQDTADTVGISKSLAGRDIKLARDLLERPDLRKKTRKLPKHAAAKIVEQTLKEEELKRQIEMNKLTVSSTLLHGSCVDLIDDLEDESIDLWLTDPPFGSANVVKLSGANSPSGGMPTYNLTSTNVGSDEYMQPIYEALIPKVYRKLKPGAHIYVFFGHSWYCRLYKMLTEAGFEVDEQPLIWYKERPSVMAKDMHYMSSYEAVFFGHKPPVGRILSKPLPNVLSVSAIHPKKKTHPLQRPHELLKIFIENSSSVGETVLDTFAGSASTLVSARKLQRNAIGFEVDEGNYLRAQEFMAKEMKGV